ncbi:tetratricopeptide repeat protein [Aquisphaera giovannonii]|uniref:tetratricopeptide repeat protein n=1 Tax=Aquisphaera giovannonii TaxID=406548 RepID=UPI001AEF5A54|nr:tetratricopeptide repeat protein [Aquisphaera giovannonii]
MQELKDRIDASWREGKFREAVAPAEEAFALTKEVLGPEHWRAKEAGHRVDTLRTIAGLSDQGRREMARVPVLIREEARLFREGKFRDAEKIDRDLLVLRQRWLGKGHLDTAASHNNLGDVLVDLERYDEAAEQHGQSLKIKLAVLGEDDPSTARSHDNLGTVLLHLKRWAEAGDHLERALRGYRTAYGEVHPETAKIHKYLAQLASEWGRRAEAETHYRIALASLLELKEEHGEATIACREQLASLYFHRGEYADAEAQLGPMLASCLRVHGKSDRRTLDARNNLAVCLMKLSKPHEAEDLLRQNLAIELERDGQFHASVHMSRLNLAAVLQEQGRHLAAEKECLLALDIAARLYPESDERMCESRNLLGVIETSLGNLASAEEQHRRALASSLAARGELHQRTIGCRQNLGEVLRGQGKYAEAVEQQRKALGSALQAKDTPRGVVSLIRNNLALALEGLGDYEAARLQFMDALELARKESGEKSAETARRLANLSSGYREQGRLAEAEDFARRSLAIRIETLGEGSPDTAWSHNALGWVLEARRRYAEAETHFRLALTTQLSSLGEDNLDTIITRTHLASSLDELGRRDAAIEHWEKAALSFGRSRWARDSTGLDRAVRSGVSPLADLALALARRGEPRRAWERWEADLARGLLDDFSARQARPLTAAERKEESDVLGRLQTLDEGIGVLASRKVRTPDEDRQLDDLQRQQNAARGRLIALERRLDETYRALAGVPSSLEDIRTVLPVGAALVGWLDSGRHHWACVVRRDGDPAWVSIPGSGEGGTWTGADVLRPMRLRDALAAGDPIWRDLAAEIARQRIAPLLPRLEGVGHLIVLPSPALSGLPLEALLVACGETADRRLVSYAPSGSMLARLARPRPAGTGGPSLFALGDPAFAPPDKSDAPPPPDHGLAVATVDQSGGAGPSEIREGDVLLEYNGRRLAGLGDLKEARPGDPEKPTPVKIWRDGEVRELTVAAGLPGIGFDLKRSIGEVVLAHRAAEEILRPLNRGVALKRLQGSRREVEAIARLFPSGRVHTLLGEQATESAVQALAAGGDLARYRFLHFATHGRADTTIALNSEIILAPETAHAGPDKGLSGRTPEADGRITALQIVRTWQLDADLVVLSACQTALGRVADGEGYLGFSQALFVKGARSVVLSLWKVEDKATALLMGRFYENLLGKRQGLHGPMPKAAAIDEARRWLRGLDHVDAAEALAGLGKDHPPAERGGVRAVNLEPVPRGERPYAHPKHWAGFILIGDPN